MALDSMRRLVRTNRGSIIAATLVLIVFLSAFGLMPQDVFWSPDEGIKYLMLKMLQSENGIRDRLVYRGAALDPEFRFYPSGDPFPYERNIYPFRGSDGTIQYPWSQWFPLLVRPFYENLGVAGIYILPLLSGWLTTLAAARLTQQFEPSLTPWTILLSGFGTPVFFYSLMFWEHTLITLLAMIVLVIIFSRLSEPFKFLLITPILIAMIVLRPEMVAFAVALALTLLISPMLHNRFSTPLASAIPGHARYRLAYFAMIFAVFFALGLLSLLTPRYQNNIRAYFDLVVDYSTRMFSPSRIFSFYFLNLPDVLINAHGAHDPTIPDVLAWVGLLSFFFCVVALFLPRREWQSVLLFPALFALLSLSLNVLLSPENYRSLHGILLVTPYAAIAFYSVKIALNKHNDSLLTLALFTFLYLIIGTAMILLTKVDNSGIYAPGLEWGQRYLLPLYPMLAILSLVAFKYYRESVNSAWRRHLFSGVIILMMLVGVDFEIRGVAMMSGDKRSIADWRQVLETRVDAPVVTDLWWLPAVLAPYYATHEMYVVHLQNADAWLSLAKTHNVNAFTFVSQDTWDNRLGKPAIALEQEEPIRSGDMQFTRLKFVQPQTR